MDGRATGDCGRFGACLREGALDVLGRVVARAEDLRVVYAQFIEVWRERENALQAKKLTNLLLSNASHEG